MEPFISFEKVTKTYRMGEVDIKALDGVDFFVNKGEFAIVVGPSGAGKDTVLKELLAADPNICLSVSATTRAPREGEQDGKDYFFLTRPQFEEMIQKGEMLEHAEYCVTELPVSRMLVNQPGIFAANPALANGFRPTSTLGCGSWGNNSISENLTFEHLINISRVGWMKDEEDIPTTEEIWEE